MSINKRSDLKTESINKNSINIDSMSTYDILQTINKEDIKIPKIVTERIIIEIVLIT